MLSRARGDHTAHLQVIGIERLLPLLPRMAIDINGRAPEALVQANAQDGARRGLDSGQWRSAAAASAAAGGLVGGRVGGVRSCIRERRCQLLKELGYPPLVEVIVLFERRPGHPLVVEVGASFPLDVELELGVRRRRSTPQSISLDLAPQSISLDLALRRRFAHQVNPLDLLRNVVLPPQRVCYMARERETCSGERSGERTQWESSVELFVDG